MIRKRKYILTSHYVLSRIKRDNNSSKTSNDCCKGCRYYNDSCSLSNENSWSFNQKAYDACCKVTPSKYTGFIVYIYA